MVLKRFPCGVRYQAHRTPSPASLRRLRPRARRGSLPFGFGMAESLISDRESADPESEDRRVAGARSPARGYLLIRILIMAGEAAGVLVATQKFHMPIAQGLCFGLIGAMALAAA